MPQLRIAMLVVAVLLGCAPAFAATHTWKGTSSSLFSDAANWVGGSPAGDPSADLVFASDATTLAATNDLVSLTVQSITFQRSGFAITGNAITMTGGTVTHSAASGSSSIANDLTLQQDVTFNGTWTLQLDGALSGAGGPIVSGSLQLWFRGTSANSYTGDTRINSSARLTLKKTANVIAVPGDVIVTSGTFAQQAAEQIADSGSITMTGGLMVVNSPETIGPLAVSGNATLSGLPEGRIILGGDVTAGVASLEYAHIPAARVITLTSTSGLGFRTDSVSGTGIVTFEGSGKGLIGGTYTGATIIDGPDVDMANKDTDVTVLTGTVHGVAKSFTMEAGRFEPEGTGSVFAQSWTDITFEEPSVAAIDVGPVSNSLDDPYVKLDGTLTINNAALSIGFYGGIADELEGTHYLFVNASTQPVVGQFDGLPEGASVGPNHTITYVGGDGNDVVLMPPAQYATTVELVSITPHPLPYDATATIKLKVTAADPAKVPSGTGNVFIDGQLDGGYTLVDGHATVQVPHPVGRMGTKPLRITYNGNIEALPSEYNGTIDLQYPTPAIQSITPDTAQNGSGQVVVSIKGGSFYRNTVVVQDGVVVTPTYVSAVELRHTLTLTGTDARTISLEVRQPPPGIVESNEVMFTVTAPPPPPPGTIEFEANAVVAHVSANASAALLRVSGGTVDDELLTDTDSDARVRWNLGSAPQPGRYAAVDLTTGDFSVANVSGPVSPMPFPEDAFLRGTGGNPSWLVLGPGEWELLWVRPGSGAWRTSMTADNALTANGRVFFDAPAVMQPMGSAPVPSGFAAGDVLIAIDRATLAFVADRVDSHLDDASGPGVVSFAEQGGYVADEGDSVEVTVVRTGGTDGTVTVDYTTANGTAQAGLQYVATGGRLTFGAGEIAKTFTVETIADSAYSGGTTEFVVRLVDPAGTTIDGATEVSIQYVDDDTPLVYVSGADALESDGVAVIALRLTEPAATPVTLSYSTVEGSAQSPGDYVAKSGTVTFAPFQTRVNVQIDLRDDADAEGAEEFTVQFTAPGVTIEPSVAVVRIADDDSGMAILVAADAPILEGNDGVRQLELTFRLSRAVDTPVSVTWTTAPITAGANDYRTATGTIVFAPGVLTQTITIDVFGDRSVEANETFAVVLTNITGAAAARDQLTCTILNDDHGKGRRRSVRR